MQIGFKMARAAMLKAFIDNAASKINYEPKVDFGNTARYAAQSGKEAGREAGSSYKDALEEELRGLDSVISGLTKAIDGQ